ncbi:MAG: hypothetical protein LBH77_10945 [Tannerella sp.]|jgi:hypothetical protein|nr:hypothetical protein [Tannerella sp.]
MKKDGTRKFQMSLHLVAIPVLAFVLLFSFVSCDDDKDSPEENIVDTQEPLVTKIKRDALRYIAVAAERSFEGMAKSALNTGYSIRPGTREISNPRIRYEYDVIKITNSVRFSAEEFDIPVIREVCGEGEIEIYTAGFVLYVYEGEDKGLGEKPLVPMLGDEIIIFKGEWGMYCCALNSWSAAPNSTNERMPGILGAYSIYSSHKHFNGKALEKEYIYPLHQFYLDNKDGMYRIAALTDYDDNDYSVTQWYTLSNRGEVNPDRFFDMAELSALPDVSQQCKVTGIGEGCFFVETDGESALKKVYFDEYTEFVINGASASYENVTVGDMLNVRYEKLYESYKPKYVVADIIDIMNNN